MEQKLFSRNFVLLVLGQASSLFGNFILRLALSMYVLEETGSAAIFAGILSIAVVPTILLSPFGGILADRADRRIIMTALDALTGLSVLCTVAFLNKGGGIAAVGILLVILSILGAFETPTVQACVPQILSGGNIIKGNAVINQAASISYLTGPAAGGVLYAAFGLKPVMLASVICFFATALFECFIKLDYHRNTVQEKIWSLVKNDFAASTQFLVKEQPGIWRLLLLASVSRFFVMGVTIVGLPFLVRNILGLSAEYYGAAESALAVAAVLGSIAAGLLAEKWKARKLSQLLAMLGIFMLPGGMAFLFPLQARTRYLVIVAAFCGMQIVINLFSIVAVSMIQQRTPNHLLGKVMAYTSAVTMCIQPAGQMVYGLLFDCFRDAVSLVLLITGAVVWGIGAASGGFFAGLEEENAVR